MELKYTKQYNTKVDAIITKTTEVTDQGIDLGTKGLNKGLKFINKWGQKGVGLATKAVGDALVATTEVIHQTTVGVVAGVKAGKQLANVAKAMNATPAPATVEPVAAPPTT